MSKIKPRDVLERMKPCVHGSTTKDVLDFSTNMYPVNLPDEIINAINDAVSNIGNYPDPDCVLLRERIAEQVNGSVDNVIVGNGCTGLIRLISFCYGKGVVFIPQPTYGEYEYSCRLYGAKTSMPKIPDENGFVLTEDILRKMPDKTKLVFLCNPNNPTARMIPKKMLFSFLDGLRDKDVLLVLDEVYYDLSDTYTLIEKAPEFENLIVLRSLTKAHGLCGLRLGYAVAHEEIVNVLDKARPPWNVNTIAQGAGMVCSGNSYLESVRKEAVKSKGELESELKQIPGFHVNPSETNFFLVNIKGTGYTSTGLTKQLLEKGVYIRDCNSFPYLREEYVRIGVKKPEMNKILMERLMEVL